MGDLKPVFPSLLVALIVVSCTARQSPPITTGGGLVITSRYADQPGVSINEQSVPARFRSLLRLARTWAIGDDLERSRYMDRVSFDEKKRLVDAVRPHFDALAEWSAAENQRIPVRDEVVLLDMLAEAAAEAFLEVYPSDDEPAV